MAAYQHTKQQNFSIQISGNPVVKSFLAGSLSGTCSTLLFQPLDLVKTRIQQANTRQSMFTQFHNIVVSERVKGLWKGTRPSLVRTVPGVGVYFACMHTMKTTFFSGRPSAGQSLVVGAGARTLAGCIMIPVTVIKIRCEAGSLEYRGIFSALKTLTAAEGAKGLTKGLLPTLLRDVPFSGIYLMFYEKLKVYCKDLTPYGNINHFSCGIGAGVLGSLVTQPADVIKTKLQLNPGSKTINIMKEIARSEGAAGFMRGIVPRSLRRTLMAALAWTVYERAMKNIGLK